MPSVVTPSPATSARADAAVLATIAAADLAFHLALSGRYGYWIDELYFIACGAHLDWGYVDHPPLIAAIAAVSRWLLGDSLFALRLLPALAGAGLVFLTGWTARRLGGGRLAQVVAALAIVAAPVFAVFAGVLTMNSFEPLLWLACVYLVVVIVQDGRPSLWLAVGVVGGVGLLNKHSIGFFLLALVAGLLVSPQRRLLYDARAWLGAAVAILIVLPHIRWQIAHGWPTLELLANARRYQHEAVTPLEFVWGQVQIAQPIALPLWLAGAWFLLVDPRAAQVRWLGWAFVFQFFAFLLMQAKTYYLAPAYPALFAAGGIVVGDLARRRRWVGWAVIVLLIVGGLAFAPYVRPILPVAALPTYLRLLGMKEVRPEKRQMGDVPQIFADMLAWEELVAEVARVYARLTPAERRDAVLWTSNYGAAGAIDYFGPAYGLPEAVSGVQNYYLWGPGDRPGEPMIAVGFNAADLAPWFETVEAAGEVPCEYCMPDRRVQRIYICRRRTLPLPEFWPLTKCWTCGRAPFRQR